MAHIKAYRPSSHSLSSGQVLAHPYDYEKAWTIVKEMTDSLILDLVEKRLVTDQIALYAAYEDKSVRPANGTARLGRQSSSTSLIMGAMTRLFKRIVNPKLTIRRIGVAANNVISESQAETQLDLFEEEVDTSRERKQQEAIISIRRKFGKNAILKGMDFEEGATARERNNQIGGHKA